jgi:hypothetical protein
MRYAKLALVIAVVGVFPAVAIAHRLANPTQKAALTRAFRTSANGEPVPERCLTVEISTANSSWAQVSFAFGRNGRLPSGCLKYAANGVSIFQSRAGRWHFVTAGSDFAKPNGGCGVPHVPKRVVSDFKLCG